MIILLLYCQEIIVYVVKAPPTSYLPPGFDK
jgi:hypothetical protein